MSRRDDLLRSISLHAAELAGDLRLRDKIFRREALSPEDVSKFENAFAKTSDLLLTAIERSRVVSKGGVHASE